MFLRRRMLKIFISRRLFWLMKRKVLQRYASCMYMEDDAGIRKL